MMDAAKRKRLEAAGWTFGDHGDFLGLTDAERQQVELRIALSRGVRRLRESAKMTQEALAQQIDSTQSRIAKVESGTARVSLDLMFRAYFAAGGKTADLAEPISARTPARKPEKKTAGKSS